MGITPIGLHEFTVDEKTLPDGGRYLEFIHDRTGYGLNIPVPTYMERGSESYKRWSLNQYLDTVEPLVRKCIEEEARLGQAS